MRASSILSILGSFIDAQDLLCAQFCNNGTVIPPVPDVVLGLAMPDGVTNLTCGNIHDFIQSSPIDSNSVSVTRLNTLE